MARIPSKEEIEVRAYEIYLERGGDELENWLTAERDLTEQASRSEMSLSTGVSSSPSKKAAAAGSTQQAGPTSTRRA